MRRFVKNRFFRNILPGIFKKNQSGFLSEIKRITGVNPHNPDIYITAFTQKSLKKKDKNGNYINYERMEFLGDSLLSAVITDYLYTRLINGNEGELTVMRSKMVARYRLNKIGEKMKLDSLVIKDPNEKNKLSGHVQGDLLEALTAAVYLDRGYDVMKEFVLNKIIIPYMDLQELRNFIHKYKVELMEWCQKKKKSYQCKFEGTTLDNNKRTLYIAQIYIDDIPYGKAKAYNKKAAEEWAAKKTFKQIFNK